MDTHGFHGGVGYGDTAAADLPHVEVGQPVVEIGHDAGDSAYTIVDCGGVPHLVVNVSVAAEPGSIGACVYLNTLNERDRTDPTTA